MVDKKKIMHCSGANVRVNYLENPPKCVGGKSAEYVVSVISPVLF
jgi:hypothetical protein